MLMKIILILDVWQFEIENIPINLGLINWKVVGRKKGVKGNYIALK